MRKCWRGLSAGIKRLAVAADGKCQCDLDQLAQDVGLTCAGVALEDRKLGAAHCDDAGLLKSRSAGRARESHHSPQEDRSMADGKSTVQYREVPGFPGYRVGDDGSVWSCWRRSSHGRGRGGFKVLSDSWRRLKVSVHQGAARCNLGRGNLCRVGRLVLECFVGPCPAGMECCHFPDRDPSNCCLDNLRWGTSAENTEDQRRHSTLIGGERHGMAKLSNEEIEEIRAMAGTMSQRAIGDCFGIKQPHVSDILRNKKRTTGSHSGKGVRNG